MSGRFITCVIIGAAFGFTQLWFAYWVVKLYKEKQRILRARREAGAAAQPSDAGAARMTSGEGPRPGVTKPPAGG